MKNKYLRSLIVLLVSSFIVMINGTSAFDFDFFLNQPHKVKADQHPWHQARPVKVSDRFSAENTAWRDPWQPEPQLSHYRPHQSFYPSIYQYWQTLDTRGYPIVDEQDSGPMAFCYHDDSEIWREALPQAEVDGRCCACQADGRWGCEFQSIDEDRQCAAADIALNGFQLEKDRSYRSFSDEKFFFHGTLKNAGKKESTEVTVTVALDGEVLSERNFGILPALTNLELSEKDFGGIQNGIVLKVGNEYDFTVTTEQAGETEEPDTENNIFKETLTLVGPQFDYQISQLNAQVTGLVDEEGQKQVRFEIGVKNVGDFLGQLPEQFTIGIFTDPDLPALVQEGIGEQIAVDQERIYILDTYLPEGNYLLVVALSSVADAEEKSLDNNLSDLSLIVD